MRLLASLALLIALIALGVAAVAVTGGESQRAASNAELAAAKQRADELESRIDKLQVQLDAAKAAPKPAAASPAADAAAPAVSADDAHIKEVVDAELQAQFQKMRAQWGGGPGGGGFGGGTAALGDAATVKAQLGVTDDQKAEQTAKIVTDMRAAIRDVWRSGGDRDANTKKMQDLRADAETKLAALLSADELAKAKQLLDQPGGGRRRGQGQGGNGGDAGAAPAGGEPPAAPKGTSF